MPVVEEPLKFGEDTAKALRLLSFLHVEHPCVQRCCSVRAFRERRMKPARLGGEGQAAGGKRGSPRVKMGSHVWVPLEVSAGDPCFP